MCMCGVGSGNAVDFEGGNRSFFLYNKGFREIEVRGEGDDVVDFEAEMGLVRRDDVILAWLCGVWDG